MFHLCFICFKHQLMLVNCENQIDQRNLRSFKTHTTFVEQLHIFGNWFKKKT